MSGSKHGLEFVMSGKTKEGTPFTPNSIPLAELSQYVEDVNILLRYPTTELNLKEINVRIEEGSLKLIILLPIIFLTHIEAQFQKAKEDPSYWPPKSAKILMRWQENARRDKSRSYSIQVVGESEPVLKITGNSNIPFSKGGKEFGFEQYVVGKVSSVGGTTHSNVHIKMDSDLKSAIIDADPEFIKNLKENIVYHEKMIRLVGRRSLKKDASSFGLKVKSIQDTPVYNREKLKGYIDRARNTWRGIDSKAWLEEIRRGDV